MIRVLMISKACLVGAYQTKLEAIAHHDDIELTVIVPLVWHDSAGSVWLERAHTEGYQLLVDPIRFNGQFHLHYYPTLKKRLAALRPDVVHIDEEPYNLATWLALRQARRVGAKTLFFSWQNLLRRYPFPFSYIEQQVLQGVDYGIMGNQASVEVWRSKGYTGRYRVIPQFGVDEQSYRPVRQLDRGRVFTIGSANRRLVAEKGVDLLLRAVAELPGVWRLLIAGEGPERPLLEKLAGQLGVAERVQFDGAIGSAEMPTYLSQLDALVLSSRTLPNWKEQFGRILVEAMACGVPVIGAESGEIPHVIGEAGLTFPEGDVGALREQLQRLMQSETLGQELAKKGRQHVVANYTQAEIAAQTVSVYRELMFDE